MKTIGITDKEKQLLFIVLSIGLLLCAYFFGFTKLMDQAALIETSNKQDEATLKNLREMYNNLDATKQETEQFKTNIKKIVAKYPVDVPQEKSIYLIQEMEDIVGLHVDTINFSMNNLLMDFNGSDSPTGFFNVLGVHFSSSYEQFKELLKHVRDYPDRCTAPSVSVEFDQNTGRLTGTISYRMFYLTKTDSEFDNREYEEVPPTGIECGVDSIFGSLIEYTDEEGNTGYTRFVYNPILEGEEENSAVAD